MKQHAGTDRITGSPTADKRAALVENFRDESSIMIATEAAAEGINLQFCNLVVNYDMPWNPQRIEQRIGRCHRYGQKYDVVARNQRRKDLFVAQDEVEARRESLIADIEGKLKQKQELTQLFAIRWRLE